MRESLANTDRPGPELEQLVDDLHDLVWAFRKLLSDFSAMKRLAETWPLPKPSEDAPHSEWDAYHQSVRYRLPTSTVT